MKTHSGAKKRLRVKASGLLKRRKTGLRHLLSHKSSSRKRHLGLSTHVNETNTSNIERLLPGRVLRGIKEGHGR